MANPGDETSVLASVSGPIEVRLAAELPSKATFEVLVRPLSNVSATEAKLVAANIKSTLEPSLILTKSPRTMVQLVVQSLASPRSALWKHTLMAAMINASTLAFLQAGSVLMQGVITAVAVGRLPNGTLVLDPSEEEEKTLQGGGSFAFMFSEDAGAQKSRVDCVWSNWKATNGYSPNELFAARECAKAGATTVHESIRRNTEALGEATEIRFPISQPKERAEGSDDEEKMEI